MPAKLSPEVKMSNRVSWEVKYISARLNLRSECYQKFSERKLSESKIGNKLSLEGFNI